MADACVLFPHIGVRIVDLSLFAVQFFTATTITLHTYIVISNTPRPLPNIDTHAHDQFLFTAVLSAFCSVYGGYLAAPSVTTFTFTRTSACKVVNVDIVLAYVIDMQIYPWC